MFRKHLVKVVVGLILRLAIANTINAFPRLEAEPTCDACLGFVRHAAFAVLG